MNRNLANFNVAVCAVVKTPGLSPVKTRLAKTIGQAEAESFYSASLQSIQGLFESLKKSNVVSLENRPVVFHPYFAVAEASALNHLFWEGHRTLVQSTGGLGERLFRVYSSFQKEYDAVIIVGGDLPHFMETIFFEVAIKLATKTEDFILGPTNDGGYYLFAGSKNVPESAFTGVEYSVATTCAEFSDQLRRSGTLSFLEKNWDVDEWEDLQKLRELYQFGVLPEHCGPLIRFFASSAQFS